MEGPPFQNLLPILSFLQLEVWHSPTDSNLDEYSSDHCVIHNKTRSTVNAFSTGTIATKATTVTRAQHSIASFNARGIPYRPMNKIQCLVVGMFLEPCYYFKAIFPFFCNGWKCYTECISKTVHVLWTLTLAHLYFGDYIAPLQIKSYSQARGSRQQQCARGKT